MGFLFFLRRPKEFVECEDPIDHKGNKTAKEETGFGCVKVRLRDCFSLFSRSVCKNSDKLKGAVENATEYFLI